jgi:hypothetical protein
MPAAELPTDPAALRAAFERVIGQSPFTGWMGTTIDEIAPGRAARR